MEPIAGTIEVIDSSASRGIPVAAATDTAVPTIVEAVFGIANVVPAEAVPGAVACWDAENDIGAPVQVILWPEADLPLPRPQPDGEG